MASPAASFRPVNQALLPLLRSAAGRWVHSPLIGYLAVLTTTGRRTGQPRSFPLSYALVGGNVYFMAGYGRRSDWFRNLQANPSVTVELPGRVVHGIAEEVTDPIEEAIARAAVLRNSGLSVFSLGINPFRVTAEDVRGQDFGDRPMVRVRSAQPVKSGTWDAGGPGWLFAHVVAPLAGALTGLWAVRRRSARVAQRGQ